MRRELSKHLIAYVILAVGLILIGIIFFGVWPNHVLQRAVAGALAVFYFTWGVISHVKTDHLSKRVVAEYAGVALLASVMLLFVTI